MNIGVQLPNPPEPPAANVDPAVMAKDVEDAGFESYWVSDHPVAPVECASYSPVFPGGQVPGFMDPIVAMAMAAKSTSHIKIGTCVLLMPERNALLLAKQIATLDRYGGGRFIFGIGTGWNREETAIMGGDTDRPWAQSLEACLVMKELWTKERAEFRGEFHDFPLLRCDPKPLQQPNPPILIGGYAKNVLPRVVKYGDGWLPHRFTPQALGEKIRELHELAAAAGRDPASLDVTMLVGEDEGPDIGAAYIEAGANRIILRTTTGADQDTVRREIEQHAKDYKDYLG